MKPLLLKIILLFLILKLSNSNQISIKIKGNEYQKILFINKTQFPDEIHNNGKVEIIDNNEIFILNDANEIKLI